VLAFLLVMVAAAAVVLIVSAPFRRVEVDGGDAKGEESTSEVAELEAAKEAKYREIRDAELDHRTGKLSDEDFQSLDNALRAEAISILQALDRARES
jgi:transcriptional regulator of heat shock response